MVHITYVMHISEFSFTGFISSIVNEVSRTNSKFFLEEILKRKKKHKTQINAFPFLWSFCAQKIFGFLILYLLVFILSISFHLFCVFCVATRFLKKFKLVVETSYIILLMFTPPPPQLPYFSLNLSSNFVITSIIFIYMYLVSFVRTDQNLWKYFLFSPNLWKLSVFCRKLNF